MTAVPDQAQRPPNLLYAVNEWPPPLRLALLGLQYAVMAAIYLVLVAIILRDAKMPPSASIDAMGIACVGLAIGTALQALPQGPIGSGFLAPPAFSAVYLAPSVLAAQIGGMPLVFGMIVFAGVVEVLFALALNRLRVVVTPVLSGLTVFVVGLQLGVVGIGAALDVRYVKMPGFHLHLLVTLLTLFVCIGLSIWGRGTVKLLCSLLGLIAGMTAASAIGLLNPVRLAALGESPWISLPHPSFFHLSFDTGLMPAFLACGVAASLRAVGVITTCQRINNAAWRRPNMTNIRKGMLADGLSNVIGGLVGVPGMSIGPSMVGVSAATGATSRYIGFTASLVLLIFASSPRLSGLFLVVPENVAGSLLVFTASFMISSGMEIMLSRSVDTRAVYVIGVSTLLALSEKVFPDYFRALPPAVQSLTASPLALGLMFAIALTLIFRLGTRQTAQTAWSESADAAGTAVAFIQSKTKAWNLAATLIETSAAHTGEVIRYILTKHLSWPEGRLRLTNNGVELGIEISYQGSRTSHVPPSREAPIPIANELENEEGPAYAGLQNFLRSLAVDRHQIKTRNGKVIVRLFYAI